MFIGFEIINSLSCIRYLCQKKKINKKRKMGGFMLSVLICSENKSYREPVYRTALSKAMLA